MEKVIRDGKVAVLISQGWGAGWYSWHRDKQELLFSPKLVEMVEQNRKNEISKSRLDLIESEEKLSSDKVKKESSVEELQSRLSEVQEEVEITFYESV
jgi:hypothetical protein